MRGMGSIDLIASTEVTMLTPKLSALTLVSLLATAACGDDDTMTPDGGKEVKKDAATTEDSGPGKGGEVDSGSEMTIDAG